VVSNWPRGLWLHKMEMFANPWSLIGSREPSDLPDLRHRFGMR
jgi:hypothetical protein